VSVSCVKDTEDKKRASYTSGNENVLHNFVRDGEIAGIPPMQNWLAHFLKQVAAIVSFVKNPEIEPSEPLVSRAADLINYAVLMVAMAEDSGRETGLQEEWEEFKNSVLIEFNGIEHTCTTGPYDYMFGKDDV